jgi:hypothetical protein
MKVISLLIFLSYLLTLASATLLNDGYGEERSYEILEGFGHGNTFSKYNTQTA